MSDIFSNYPALLPIKDNISEAITCLERCFEAGGKLLLCGNGGSAADCDHIVGELMKSFKLPRPMPQSFGEALESENAPDAEYLASNLQAALPAIALHTQSSLVTAFSNDASPDLVFAQAVSGLGQPGDALLAISTSGKSANIVYAAETARALGIRVISLTGESSGRLDSLSDIIIKVPATETYRVQEYHLPVYHYICAELEKHFFGNQN